MVIKRKMENNEKLTWKRFLRIFLAVFGCNDFTISLKLFLEGDVKLPRIFASNDFHFESE